MSPASGGKCKSGVKNDADFAVICLQMGAKTVGGNELEKAEKYKTDVPISVIAYIWGERWGKGKRETVRVEERTWREQCQKSQGRREF